VWKSDSYQVRTAEREARWLCAEGAHDIALRHDLERLACDLGVVTRSAAPYTLTAPGLVATREALQKAFGHADQIIRAPVLQRVTHIDAAIEAFAAVVRAAEPPAATAVPRARRRAQTTGRGRCCRHRPSPRRRAFTWPGRGPKKPRISSARSIT